jgi:hypothetical protein
MTADAFAALRSVFAGCKRRLAVKVDTPSEYTLVTKAPSPFPQHKGQPLFIGSVRAGKAYVSLHLVMLYLCPDLTANITPGLRKRMHGKACFNFKTAPSPELLAELKGLAEAGVRECDGRGWL